jgi:hypothetical protein
MTLDDRMIEELERMWKETVGLNEGIISDICMEILRKTMKNLMGFTTCH